ncbi:eukaryotic translation initiation factor 3 subunit 8 N-terminus-domain-containing protein [Phycomyces nitens]|nr:eukaryotic translation initiation factor 3 subunit 8 N-terminus-domain-containing protein [Phycomyces nitens]
MSRFFRSASDSESDSESSDNESYITDDDHDSTDDEVEQGEQEEAQPKKSRFLKGTGSDSDTDDESNRKRHVKSQKDKRLDEMENSIKALESSQKNNDWGRILAEFDKLSLHVTKAVTGFDSIPVPKGYIKTIVDIDALLQESKNSKKKLNVTNSKAMNVMKQKMKKITKQYEDLIAEYNKDPEAFMEEEEEEIVEEKVVPVKKAVVDVVAEEEDDGFTSVGKGGKRMVELTADNFFSTLKEVLENRGKKNTNRDDQIITLQRLLKSARSPFQIISVLLLLISSRFDINLSMAGFLPVPVWKAAEKELNLLLETLEKNPQFVVREDAEMLEEDDKDITPAPGQVVALRGSVVSFIERLDDEFTKSLQNIDQHSTDYIDRLRDEPQLYTMLVRVQIYGEKYNMENTVSRVVMRRIDHLYFKPDAVIRSIEASAATLLPKNLSSKIITSEEPSELIHQLCAYLYRQKASALRTRAMLCHIYHIALHKQFYTARDMLLMSHLQESIHQADITTQLLYNRAMVQIGLCAFREGLFKEAHAALQEIQGSGRVKELLGQGVQTPRYGQQTAPEVDQLERQRQLPFHMHINLELLECVFLTCSMLLEIPAQAQAGPNTKKFISRPFKRLLDYNERQAFSGPPENTRDHIMSAAKALASGEWERARDSILAIKVWDLMQDTEAIKEMLVKKIQEEGLRTYLFTYAPYYSTIGLEQLAKMFALEPARVSAIVAKLILNEELSASLDQVSKVIVLHQVELSQLQILALQFADKAASMVDQNERLSTGGRENQKNHTHHHHHS